MSMWWNARQFTKDEASHFYDSHVWELMSAHEIVKIQLFQKLNILPMSIFILMLEKVLKRSISGMELCYPELLQNEYIQKYNPKFVIVKD